MCFEDEDNYDAYRRGVGTTLFLSVVMTTVPIVFLLIYG